MSLPLMPSLKVMVAAEMLLATAREAKRMMFFNFLMCSNLFASFASGK